MPLPQAAAPGPPQTLPKEQSHQTLGRGPRGSTLGAEEGVPQLQPPPCPTQDPQPPQHPDSRGGPLSLSPGLRVALGCPPGPLPHEGAAAPRSAAPGGPGDAARPRSSFPEAFPAGVGKISPHLTKRGTPQPHPTCPKSHSPPLHRSAPSAPTPAQLPLPGCPQGTPHSSIAKILQNKAFHQLP